jgi:hypothetical protein
MNNFLTIFVDTNKKYFLNKIFFLLILIAFISPFIFMNSGISETKEPDIYIGYIGDAPYMEEIDKTKKVDNVNAIHDDEIAMVVDFTTDPIKVVADEMYEESANLFVDQLKANYYYQLSNKTATFDIIDAENTSTGEKNSVNEDISLFILVFIYCFTTFFFSIISGELSKQKISNYMRVIFTSISVKKYYIYRFISLVLMQVLYILSIASTIFIALSITEYQMNDFDIKIVILIIIFVTLYIFTTTSFVFYNSSIITNFEDLMKISIPGIIVFFTQYHIITGVNSFNPELIKYLVFVPFYTPFTTIFLILENSVSNIMLVIYFIYALIIVILTTVLSYKFYKRKIN